MNQVKLCLTLLVGVAASVWWAWNLSLETQRRHLENAKILKINQALLDWHSSHPELDTLVPELQTYLGDYRSQVQSSQDLSWLRKLVIAQGLDFIKYQRTSSSGPQTRVQLQVQGDEPQFWSLIEVLGSQYPWILVEQFELNSLRERLSIKKLYLSWNPPEKQGEAEDQNLDLEGIHAILKDDTLQSKFQMQVKYIKSVLDNKKIAARSQLEDSLKVDTQKLNFLGLARAPKVEAPRVRAPSVPEFSWPTSWKIQGSVAGKGFTLKVGGQSHFWKVGQEYQGLMLLELGSNSLKLKDLQGRVSLHQW